MMFGDVGAQSVSCVSYLFSGSICFFGWFELFFSLLCFFDFSFYLLI